MTQLLESPETDIRVVEEQLPAGLRHLTDIFLTLNERGIRYCHWKSNVRLTESLEGLTDLDLLDSLPVCENISYIE